MAGTETALVGALLGRGFEQVVDRLDLGVERGQKCTIANLVVAVNGSAARALCAGEGNAVKSSGRRRS